MSTEASQHLLILLDLLLVDLLLVVIIAGRDGRHRRFTTAGRLVDVHAVVGVIVSASHYREELCSVNAKEMAQRVGFVSARLDLRWRTSGSHRVCAISLALLCWRVAVAWMFPKECL